MIWGMVISLVVGFFIGVTITYLYVNARWQKYIQELAKIVYELREAVGDDNT